MFIPKDLIFIVIINGVFFKIMSCGWLLFVSLKATNFYMLILYFDVLILLLLISFLNLFDASFTKNLAFIIIDYLYQNNGI
jgi:hypothetical protein